MYVFSEVAEKIMLQPAASKSLRVNLVKTKFGEADVVELGKEAGPAASPDPQAPIPVSPEKVKIDVADIVGCRDVQAGVVKVAGGSSKAEDIHATDVGTEEGKRASKSVKKVQKDVVQSAGLEGPEIAVKKGSKGAAKVRKSGSKGSGKEDPDLSPATVELAGREKADKKRKGSEVTFNEGEEYRLMSPFDTTETVGTCEAFLFESGDERRFHHKPIPPGYMVVILKTVIQPKILLPFPNKHDDPAQTELAHALGGRMLWPIKCVKKMQAKRRAK